MRFQSKFLVTALANVTLEHAVVWADDAVAKITGIKKHHDFGDLTMEVVNKSLANPLHILRSKGGARVQTISFGYSGGECTFGDGSLRPKGDIIFIVAGIAYEPKFY